ncbi:unnamed protein product, partial [Laminaria digitata]
VFGLFEPSRFQNALDGGWLYLFSCRVFGRRGERGCVRIDFLCPPRILFYFWLCLFCVFFSSRCAELTPAGDWGFGRGEGLGEEVVSACGQPTTILCWGLLFTLYQVYINVVPVRST